MLKRGKNVPRLQELILVSNRSTPTALDMIMESIKVSTSLKNLTLQNMDLSDRQFNVLIEYLGESKMLTELDISWNALSSHHMVELFNALETNQTIKYLNLSHLKMHR